MQLNGSRMQDSPHLNAAVVAAEHLRGQAQAPSCQIRHRRFRQKASEALNERRTRQPHFLRQFGDRPRVVRPAVEQG